jgi:dihydrodipicolinate synthase/N-acetylneuraminate lyase
MLYAFFDERDALDRRAFRQQVEAVVASGAHGIAVLGALSPAERRTLVDRAVEDVAGRAPLMATIDRAADRDPERAGLSRLRPGNRK